LGIVGNGAISAFKKDAESKEIINNYNSSTGEYEKIKFIGKDSSIAGASINFIAPTLQTGGTVVYRSKLSFDIVDIMETGPYPQAVYPTIAPLIDLDRTTGDTFNFVTWTGTGLYLSYITINQEQIATAKKLYFGFDFNTFGGGSTVTATISIHGRNQYGGLMANYKTIDYVMPDGASTKNMLPGWYYTGGDANNEGSVFGLIKADALFDDYLTSLLKDGLSVAIEISFKTVAGFSGTAFVKEFGIWAEYEATLSDKIFTRVSGEKVEGVASNSVYTALRLMLETYDEIAAADLDYGNLATTRSDWYVGRQLTERKNSADYIQELCQQAFVAAFQNRKGKIAFSAWRDRTDTPHTHNNTTILRDSIQNWEPVTVDKIFNAFTVNYSYDPGGDKYFSCYQIAGVDNPAGSPTGDLGALWDICQGCYLEYKAIKEFKIDLSWFNDRLRWYNSGEAGVGLGTDGSAWKFLLNAVYWITRQRRKVEYALPISATNVLMELCDPVDFRDTIYTNAVTETAYLNGSIYSVEYDLKADSIRIGSMLEPNDGIDDAFGDIVETGSAATTITESGPPSDTITEDGV
jgi:hypothetical protein